MRSIAYAVDIVILLMGIDIVIVMYACQPLIICRDWYGLKNSPFLKKNRC